MMALNPKKSAEFIASKSKNVKVNQEGITKLANELNENLESGQLTCFNFSQCEVHPKVTDPWALDWILVADTLNFCFWHYENEPGWTVDGYTGYFALCAALNRALKTKPDFLNPKYYSTITEEELGKLLKGDTEIKIPLLPERVKCLHEVGAVLLEKFDGSFTKFVKEADKNAETLLKMIVDNFKCFRDEAEYKGETVSFYKRAQILIGDIWSLFKGEGLGEFLELDKITMFADYRVPQSLIYYGALEYTERLNKKLRENVLLQNGEEDEVEIRGCSIHAVELVKQQLLQKHNVNSIVIDHFLWDFRRKNCEKIEKMNIPFHKTHSIHY